MNDANTIAAFSGEYSLPIGNSKFTLSPIPVGELRVYKDGKYYTYKPQEDITTYELSLLMVMFVTASVTSGIGYHYYDYWGYVVEHNLERHFVGNE
jgi:hypothetical protein